MNGYQADIYTNDFAPVDEYHLQARSMNEAVDRAEAWMNEVGYPLHRFRYEITQVSGPRESFLFPL